MQFTNKDLWTGEEPVPDENHIQLSLQKGAPVRVRKNKYFINRPNLEVDPVKAGRRQIIQSEYFISNR